MIATSLKRIVEDSGLLSSRVFRVLNMPRRLRTASAYYAPRIPQIARWTLASKEDTNFTYPLEANNLLYLAHFVSVIANAKLDAVQASIREAEQDADLRQHVLEATRRHGSQRADPRCEFGRRLAWYAFARILKPAVVVETGVDKGLGAVLLCAALLRNAAEGSPGRYYGTDIDPAAGWLLAGPYASVGRVLYGDSLASLRRLDERIDLFINDSDHSAAYEYEEYRCVEGKLSARAVIIGDNAHITPELARFSEETGRRFLFFAEKPADHWYPGCGLGVSF